MRFGYDSLYLLWKTAFSNEYFLKTTILQFLHLIKIENTIWIAGSSTSKHLSSCAVKDQHGCSHLPCGKAKVSRFCSACGRVNRKCSSIWVSTWVNCRLEPLGASTLANTTVASTNTDVRLTTIRKTLLRHHSRQWPLPSNLSHMNITSAYSSF